MRNETAFSGESTAPPLCGSDPTILQRRFGENSRERGEWSTEWRVDFLPGVRTRDAALKYLSLLASDTWAGALVRSFRGARPVEHAAKELLRRRPPARRTAAAIKRRQTR
jgi:hypothetical protein